MPVRVRFRLNKLTGEVEEFLVDDQNHNLPEAEHDRIAAEVGRVVARRPRVQEVLPGTLPTPDSRRDDSPAESERDGDQPETLPGERP